MRWMEEEVHVSNRCDTHTHTHIVIDDREDKDTKRKKKGMRTRVKKGSEKGGEVERRMRK